VVIATQGRDILQIRCQYQPPCAAIDEQPTPLLVLNSHLESEKASSPVRTAQLVQLAQLAHAAGREERGGVALIAGVCVVHG
jgi:hypothetical protein